MSEYFSAVGVLKKILVNGKSLDSCLTQEHGPMARQICYGVLRNYYQLDTIIDLLVEKPITSKNIDLRILLLTGIYSIEHLNRPDYSSVNAAVETTTHLKNHGLRGWSMVCFATMHVIETNSSIKLTAILTRFTITQPGCRPESRLPTLNDFPR